MYRKPISSTFDLSHFSHFLLYFIFGLIYPNKYVLIIIISIVWEMFEYIIVHNDYLYHLTKKYWFIPEKYWNETIENQIIDFGCNLLGYYFGSKIKNIKDSKILCQLKNEKI